MPFFENQPLQASNLNLYPVFLFPISLFLIVVPVSIQFFNVTSAATSIPETLEQPGKFALNMTRSKFSIFVRDMKAKNIRILQCDGQTVSKVRR